MSSNPKWEEESFFFESSDEEYGENEENNVSNEPKKKNYYDILDISKLSTIKEITKAYKKKAIILHPDKHINEKEKYTILFQELSEAYCILKDPKTKELYDKYGDSGIKKCNFFIPHTKNDFDMLFKMAFKDEISKNDKYAYLSKPQCPPILKTIIIKKNTKKINFTYKKKKPCKEEHNQECIFCKGYVKTIGFLSWYKKRCSKCNSTRRYCRKCTNTGFIQKTLNHSLKIKKDIKNNSTQVLYGIGNEAKGRVNGDVVITYKIQN